MREASLYPLVQQDLGKGHPVRRTSAPGRQPAVAGKPACI